MIYFKLNIIILFFCRQVTPAPTNRAANSLSKANQKRNIRSVEVNARITMMIWIMECMANFCVFLCVILVPSKLNLNNLTIKILWYYITMPYTFLMNTSYNKDRIIDEGWKTVLMNIFIKPHSFNARSIIGKLQTRPEQALNNANDRIIKQEREKVQECESNGMLRKSRQTRKNHPPNVRDTKIIATNELDSPKVEANQKLEVIDLEDVPSTSKN